MKSIDDITSRMVRATKRCRAKTTLGKLERIVAERSRWQRKATIARNKLATIDRRIAQIANDLAAAKLGEELS